MKSILRKLSSVFETSKPARRRTAKRNAGVTPENLEQRQVMSVSSIWMSGSTLVVKTDDASTSAEVRTAGTDIQIREVGSERTWNYRASNISCVEFQGGRGNDRFVNNIRTLPVRAFGGDGNDYLEGWDGSDVLVGGNGDDTLRGYGGNDRIWGGDGDDTLEGGSGDDQLMGGSGDDLIYGEAGRDQLWGETGNDTLLGGTGNDDLVGGSGDDQLNGQDDIDRLWGQSGNDVLIAIDNGTSDYVESGDGCDIIWVDSNGTTRDRMYGNSSLDTIQAVALFRNGADRTLNGDSIADPNGRVVDDKGLIHGTRTRRFSGNPLFADNGPQITDIRQGACGDCYFLATLGSIAKTNPEIIRQRIVDFNDGTYGVKLGSSFYRVDADLPVDSSWSSTPSYANLGEGSSMWVAIFEKAWAHYRRGQNSYASIESGWESEAFSAMGISGATRTKFSSFSTASALLTAIVDRLDNGYILTISFTGSGSGAGLPIVMNHAYSVNSFYSGIAGSKLVLRNPWGKDGGSVLTDTFNDGLVGLSLSQLWSLRSYGSFTWARA